MRKSMSRVSVSVEDLDRASNSTKGLMEELLEGLYGELNAKNEHLMNLYWEMMELRVKYCVTPKSTPGIMNDLASSVFDSYIKRTSKLPISEMQDPELWRAASKVDFSKWPEVRGGFVKE